MLKRLKGERGRKIKKKQQRALPWSKTFDQTNFLKAVLSQTKVKSDTILSSNYRSAMENIYDCLGSIYT